MSARGKVELESGIAALRSGRLEEARRCLQHAVELSPAVADGWHLLGVVELKCGNPSAAAGHFRACIRRSDRHADAWFGLGSALRGLAQREEARAAFSKALAARPEHVEAAFGLAVTLEDLGDLSAAEREYRNVLVRRAHHLGALTALGRLLCRLSRHAEALPLFQAAQHLKPDSAPANGNLAVALIELGRPADAEPHARTAAQAAPGTGIWWRTLGTAQRLCRHNDDAIASLRRALALDPDDAVAAAELAVVLADSGFVHEARAMYARVRPEAADAERLRWSLALSLPSVYTDEPEVDAERHRYAAALAEIERDLRLETPVDRQQAYNALCCSSTYLLHYQSRDNTQLQIRFGDLAARVMRARAPELMERCAWPMRSRRAITRVGIVSSHLMHHTVSRYFASLILGLDPADFEVHAWYSGGTRDFSTERFERHVASFTAESSDPIELAQRIRALKLDIVLYPEIGMDPRHHVLGALRLAPVQCVLYGHPATSGLENIDFFLSGDALEPVGGDAHYREALVRLPGIGAMPLMPAPPEVADITTAQDSGGPLLVCLQNPLKLTPAFDRVLAEIAGRSGASIGFFPRRSAIGRLFQQRIEGAFRDAGLDPEVSLKFIPSGSHASFLRTITAADFVLDSPGFSGGATSLDALSVGTPVLAWEGDLARGRQTSAMLREIGCEDLIAVDEQGYIEAAVTLCADAGRRRAYREQISARASWLFEDRRPVTAFAEFMRTVEAN